MANTNTGQAKQNSIGKRKHYRTRLEISTIESTKLRRFYSKSDSFRIVPFSDFGNSFQISENKSMANQERMKSEMPGVCRAFTKYVYKLEHLHLV